MEGPKQILILSQHAKPHSRKKQCGRQELESRFWYAVMSACPANSCETVVPRSEVSITPLSSGIAPRFFFLAPEVNTPNSCSIQPAQNPCISPLEHRVWIAIFSGNSRPSSPSFLCCWLPFYFGLAVEVRARATRQIQPQTTRRVGLSLAAVVLAGVAEAVALAAEARAEAVAGTPAVLVQQADRAAASPPMSTLPVQARSRLMELAPAVR